MKPPQDHSERFIQALCERGWEVRADVIYSEADCLFFPFPDGWHTDFDDLMQIMTRRRARFEDRGRNRYLEDAQRKQLIRVHSQVLEAIAEAKGT